MHRNGWAVEAGRFVRYCGVGVVNTGLTYLVYCLVVAVSLPSYAGLAIGYAAGMVSSYALNRVWTFRHPQAASLRTLAAFLLVNLAILGLSEGSLRLISAVIPSKYAAQAVNTVPMTMLGFLANRFLVFRG